MARIQVTDPKISDVVQSLVDAFINEGSVNAVYKALTTALSGAGISEKIYPNRIHSLLSASPNTAVNDQTIRVIQSALEVYQPKKPETSTLDKLQHRVSTALLDFPLREGAHPSYEALTKIAQAADLPLAVLQVFMGSKGAKPSQQEHLPLSAQQSPDWSFQDDAYRSAVSALQRSPAQKVGLILPTGAGKTRVAIRIALRILDNAPRKDSVVIWVTHRRFLASQARRELQRALTEGTPDLPETSVQLLHNRVQIILISQIEETLEKFRDNICLIVVDEAHHAAAPSYASLFQATEIPGLFLTATPNRSDQQAIGIDTIAYTITYRELFSRKVLIEPKFENPIEALDMGSDETFSDMADYLLERASQEFIKTVVVTSRTDIAERLYEKILTQLIDHEGHILEVSDIGFVHGSNSSTGVSPEIFLEEFSTHDRGILISTAQMLGEGYDDPKINAAVLTYPTTSMTQLMQVAGRCLRWKNAKSNAFIVQATTSNLAYHYEERWLYQDIDDRLHPRLHDLEYKNHSDLVRQTTRLLEKYNVPLSNQKAVQSEISMLGPGDSFSLLLSGMPYIGSRSEFPEAAEWRAVPVSQNNKLCFLEIFNSFCEKIHEVKDTNQFLRNFLNPATALDSDWVLYRTMLEGMRWAHREIINDQYWSGDSRPYNAATGTTWLQYVTFKQVGDLPLELERFLADALNRHAIGDTYLSNSTGWAACVKVEVPVGGSLAFLLDISQWKWLKEIRSKIYEKAKETSPELSFGVVESLKLEHSPPCPIHPIITHRLDTLISPAHFSERTLALQAGDLT